MKTSRRVAGVRNRMLAAERLALPASRARQSAPRYSPRPRRECVPHFPCPPPCSKASAHFAAAGNPHRPVTPAIINGRAVAERWNGLGLPGAHVKLSVGQAPL